MRKSDKLIYLSFFPKGLAHEDFALFHRYIVFNDLDENPLDQEASGYCPECKRFTVWKWIDNDIFSCRNCRLQLHADEIARGSVGAYFKIKEEEGF
ncbi:MAG: hypothetical protein QIT35_gp91 [Methanophagales virus PBV299]|uniref:GATA-type domain-containing protein n=1 Tax=Methanophagales virus PBV299 TaxID=2987730 RepID=A0ABY6GN91_9CAUD|nr:MAG: hypothetical protein QIT35_gp91 [Methanophagales virus PBV299]UYL64887.1 MAG: hypothetical protein OFDIEDLO_00091 [Methanophagales virus PBV299]